MFPTAALLQSYKCAGRAPLGLSQIWTAAMNCDM